jgi:tetratricopeptide (TPR) repeat protein
MRLSRCFLRSEEKPKEGKRKLGCTSCHDPHEVVAPDKRVTFFRGRCLECHKEQQCSARAPEDIHRKKTNGDSCIECHMPRFPSADIAHNASTDHRIQRPQSATPPAVVNPGKRERGIVSFYRPNANESDKEAERDLGIALAHFMVQNLAQRKPLPPRTGERALAALDAAARNDPDDVEAWEAKGEVLALVNRPADALGVYEDVLARFPQREASLTAAAMLAQSRQQRDKALDYLRRSIEVNPWHAQYRAHLAELLVEQNAWDEARTQAEAWLRLDPPCIEARFLLVRCLLRTGDAEKARTEFAKIERLRPANLGQLQARFAVESRGK